MSVIRITSVSWKHHQVVAAFEEKKQIKWLDIAENEKLKVGGDS